MTRHNFRSHHFGHDAIGLTIAAVVLLVILRACA